MKRSKSLDLTDAIQRAANSSGTSIPDKPTSSSTCIEPSNRSPPINPPKSSSPSCVANVAGGKLEPADRKKMIAAISLPLLDVTDNQPEGTDKPTHLKASPVHVPQKSVSFTGLPVGSPKSSGTDKEASCAMHIEVSPGVSTVVRSVEETMTAIRNDFFVPVFCLGCAMDLFCIANAQYVLCPTCRVVSPVVADDPLIMTAEGEEKPMGLGLGVRYEDLVSIQSEILATDSK